MFDTADPGTTPRPPRRARRPATRGKAHHGRKAEAPAVDRYELMDHVNRALHGEVLLRRDVDYVVADGKVVLVDRVTGRRRPRQQVPARATAAVEAKEGVPVVEEADALAQMPVQGFFEQYRTLCGLTGTASDAAEDFRLLYGLEVAVVPPSLPSHRIDHPPCVSTAARRRRRPHWSSRSQPAAGWGALCSSAPATVEQAGEISALLTEHAIPHNRLDAEQPRRRGGRRGGRGEGGSRDGSRERGRSGD